MTHRDSDSAHFYVNLEALLWKTKDSCNSRMSKSICQATVNIVTTSSSILLEYRTYTSDQGELITVAPITQMTEFWVTPVSTFEAMYEVDSLAYIPKRIKETNFRESNALP